MDGIYRLLELIVDLAFWVILIFVIMSWLINFQVLNTRQPMVQQIWIGLNRLLQPIFDPIRRILPDTRPLDLSPLVVVVGIFAVRDILLPTIRPLFY